MNLYFGAVSGNSARVVFAFEELGIPYVSHRLNVPEGDARTDAHLACAGFFQSANRKTREFWRRPVDTQRVEASRAELGRYLPVLQSALADRSWLEHEFSLADIAYAPHLWMITEGGYDLSPYPAVRAWLDRMLERPAWRRAQRAVFDSVEPQERSDP